LTCRAVRINVTTWWAICRCKSSKDC